MYSTNGYNFTPKVVTDVITPVDKITQFPFVQIDFSEEVYSTADTGKQSSRITEKEVNVVIDVWGEVNDNPQEWRDQVIADFEKFFENNYMIPLFSDPSLHCARDLRLERNVSFGGNVNQPKVGVGFIVTIYYGHTTGDPSVLG